MKANNLHNHGSKARHSYWMEALTTPMNKWERHIYDPYLKRQLLLPDDCKVQPINPGIWIGCTNDQKVLIYIEKVLAGTYLLKNEILIPDLPISLRQVGASTREAEGIGRKYKAYYREQELSAYVLQADLARCSAYLILTAEDYRVLPTQTKRLAHSIFTCFQQKIYR